MMVVSSDKMEVKEEGQTEKGEEQCKVPDKSETEKEVSHHRNKAKTRRISPSIFWENLKTRKGFVVKTIILGLGLNLFDVGSDVGVGISHAQEKKVKRFFSTNDTVPGYCVPVIAELDPRYKWLERQYNWKALSNSSKDVNSPLIYLTEPHKLQQIWSTPKNTTELLHTTTHECVEEDPVWAIVTLTCVQLPGLVLALCLAVGVLLSRCIGKRWLLDRHAGYMKMLVGSLFLLITPFPLVVFGQQVTSLFMCEDDQMELLSAIILFGEGALEASPQLLLLLYIILLDNERDVPLIQKASIASSILAISKTAIELFVSESYFVGIPESIMNHDHTCKDSMLKGKTLFRKLWIMAQLSPAFIVSLIFKVGSIAVICTFLKVYAAVYLAVGILAAFIVAYKNGSGKRNEDTKIGSALFYSMTNVTTLAKCPLKNRSFNYPQMMGVSLSWVVLHMTTLVGLMVWVGVMPESTHLDHWYDRNFTLNDADIFYPTVICILLLGPLSILALWGLKKQVLALEEKEKGDRKFWNADR